MQRYTYTHTHTTTTIRQVDRDRACDATDREASMLRSTQAQLSAAQSKLHSAALRERTHDAIMWEREVDHSRVRVRVCVRVHVCCVYVYVCVCLCGC